MCEKAVFSLASVVWRSSHSRRRKQRANEERSDERVGEA